MTTPGLHTIATSVGNDRFFQANIWQTASVTREICQPAGDKNPISHDDTTSDERARIILIHGAWAGAWVWHDLVLELHQLGWETDALDLPGDGFHPISAAATTEGDFHHCLKTAISRKPGQVVLVGHSGGGMLVTAAANAHPHKVTHGIWIAGFLIPDGRTYDEIRSQAPESLKTPGAMAYVDHSADSKSTIIRKEAAIELFFQDAPHQLALQAAARLTPQPAAGARIRTPINERFNELPKLYVLPNQDKSILLPVQKAMAASTQNVTVHELPTSHAPQLTRAKELADLIDRWLGDNSSA